ncbi:MinD/ParA family protein [Sulfurihydrogenibium subterraneum]|uniref:MinD/ParA family protein n=1 Tax=Sulfurihydrogenibium subterraneum TaxID=171121 RepID=UPI000B085D04|nr:MinD/ParA family protein [Sulfurihydrogenibium subterraneum]
MEQQLEHLKTLVKQKLENNNNVIKNSKFICVASGKGGVGKTNFSINFAYILANKFNKKVLLIDADIGLGNIHVILNIPLIRSLKEFFEGKKDIEENILNVKNFDLIPGFSGIDNISVLEEEKIIMLVDKLDKISKLYDYVIIDTGAGIGKDVINFVLPSDKTYLITTPEPTALTDAYSFIKSLYKIYNYKDFKVVINMVKSDEEGYEVFERLKESCKKFLELDLELSGLLPTSENLKKSVLERKLICEEYPKDKFSEKLIQIAVKETGEEIKNKEEKSFFKKFLSLIKGE